MEKHGKTWKNMEKHGKTWKNMEKHLFYEVVEFLTYVFG
jgi:hypothetical protein